jgi:hypothetical protein
MQIFGYQHHLQVTEKTCPMWISGVGRLQSCNLIAYYGESWEVERVQDEGIGNWLFNEAMFVKDKSS